jgi:hypothetical protein
MAAQAAISISRARKRDTLLTGAARSLPPPCDTTGQSCVVRCAHSWCGDALVASSHRIDPRPSAKDDTEGTAATVYHSWHIYLCHSCVACCARSWHGVGCLRSQRFSAVRPRMTQGKLSRTVDHCRLSPCVILARQRENLCDGSLRPAHLHTKSARSARHTIGRWRRKAAAGSA